MKVTETITRQCCDPVKDLKPLFGDKKTGDVFCVHCGKRWFQDTYTDGAGGRDWRYASKDD